MKSGPPPYRMKFRMIVVLLAMVLLGFMIVIHSLFQIQIVEGKYYEGLALRQQLKTQRIGAKRGLIYDTNGKILAQSATVWQVCVSPGEIVGDTDIETADNRKEIISVLNKTLGLDAEFVQKKLERTWSLYEVVKTKVEKEKKEELAKIISDQDIPGVFFEEMTRRYYPYDNLASTVLGFANDDNVGAYGLEAYYDKVLSGSPGRVVSLRNNAGVNMPLQYEQTFEAQDGNSLVLTIDESIQHFLEKNLEIAVKEHKVGKRTTGIVMDVKTGAILAMATKPDFDPNNPMEIFDEDTKKSLEELNTVGNEDNYKKAKQEAQYAQWRNKAISDPYEPGSVFKIVTFAGALESGAVTLNTAFNCIGYVEVAGHVQHCWIWGSQHQGHGQQDLTAAVKNSCNPAFIKIGQLMGVDAFLKNFDNFGLTEKTGVDLPGEATSIYHHTMGISELSTSAFGQSNKVTALQLITACSAAVNGGKLMQPYIVKQVEDQKGNVISATVPEVKRQVISEELSKTVREILEQVVEGGGSGKNARVPGYRLGGKTGTSEKLDKEASGKNILSFYGFAPADDPQVACLVMLDEPDLYNVYGSTIAAPIVGSVLADTLPYLGIEPQFTEEDIKNRKTVAPYLIGKNLHDAEFTLRDGGLKYRIMGSGTTVLRQMPGAAEPIPADGTVVLYTEEVTAENMVEVPDVTGKNAEEANSMLVGLGLNYAMTGEHLEGARLKAVGQTPGAGEKVAAGTLVTVSFTEVEEEKSES